MVKSSVQIRKKTMELASDDEDFPGGIWWLDARCLTWSERRLAKNLKLISNLEELDEENTLSALRKRIEGKGMRFLIIIENNTDDPEASTLVKNHWGTWCEGKNVVCALHSEKPLRFTAQLPAVEEITPQKVYDTMCDLHNIATNTFDEPARPNDEECKLIFGKMKTEELNALKELANELRNSEMAIVWVGKVMRMQKVESWVEMLKSWTCHKINSKLEISSPNVLEYMVVTMIQTYLSVNAVQILKLIAMWGDDCPFIPTVWIGKQASLALSELQRYALILPCVSLEFVTASRKVHSTVWRSLSNTDQQQCINKGISWVCADDVSTLTSETTAHRIICFKRFLDRRIADAKDVRLPQLLSTYIKLSENLKLYSYSRTFQLHYACFANWNQ
jgi:hypothetical protein